MLKEKVITPDMTISDILTKFPQYSQKIAQTMTNVGLHCTSCNASTQETLENGMLSHGLTQNDITSLVKKLNEIIVEEVDLTSITLTAKAAKKFQEILIEMSTPEENKAGWALRFGDTAGGCSGFEYILDFSKKADDDDVVFESHGVAIHVKKGMVKRLLGSTIDHVDSLYGSGFKVSNPNVKSSCGCGKSQGY